MEAVEVVGFLAVETLLLEPEEPVAEGMEVSLQLPHREQHLPEAAVEVAETMSAVATVVPVLLLFAMQSKGNLWLISRK